MTQRSRRNPRCLGCGLTPATCACATLPRRPFATRIAIVQHHRESFKPTNTGRLLARMVEGAALIPYANPVEPFDPAPLEDPSVEWQLLYPREGAPPLDAGLLPAPGRRRGLIVLDGTWTQCSRMSHRVPTITRFPCVALPPGPPPIWTVRTQPREHGRSTFEAALRALELLEGADAVAPLRETFARITARLLLLKGKSPAPGLH